MHYLQWNGYFERLVDSEIKTHKVEFNRLTHYKNI